MAIETVVTRGFGNGTFNGTIALATTRGYAIGAVIIFDPLGFASTVPQRGFQGTLRPRTFDTFLPDRSLSATLKPGGRTKT